MDIIFSRRSIRKYTDDPVPDEQVEQLLKAGMAAPSAGNEQPWHFVVIRNKETLEAITSFHQYAAMAPHAQVCILVCGDLDLEKYKGFWVQDCAACVQNILLAAGALGLGAVWLGIHPVEERVTGIRELLGIPGRIVPFALVPVGVPAQEAQPVDRFKAERVHSERW